MEYTCGFCGTKHNNPTDYARCVATCSEKENRRAKLLEAQEKERKTKERREKIKSVYDELMKLVNEEYKENPTSTAFDILFPTIDLGKFFLF
jgi:hypothetical protein